MFGGMKDYLASRATRRLVAGRIDRYGELLDLRIHSKERRIRVEVLPKGESEPVHVEITRYLIVDDGNGGLRMLIKEVTSSREWVHNLLVDYVIDMPIPLPKFAMAVLGGKE